MLEVPQYSLNHYFYLSFRDGGLTYSQIKGLYDTLGDRDYDRLVWEAALHGVDLKKTCPRTSSTKSSTNHSDGLFQDPAAYEHLSVEERERQTAEMKAAAHKKLGAFGG
jgi:hypothetical protein